MTKKIAKKSEDINSKLIEELLSKSDPGELFGKEGMFSQLKKQIVEKILESEIEHELGYSKHSKMSKSNSNRRNGSYEKTVLDDEGYKIPIEIPRDREGEYEPKLIPKGVRRAPSS